MGLPARLHGANPLGQPCGMPLQGWIRLDREKGGGAEQKLGGGVGRIPVDQPERPGPAADGFKFSRIRSECLELGQAAQKGGAQLRRENRILFLEKGIPFAQRPVAARRPKAE